MLESRSQAGMICMHTKCSLFNDVLYNICCVLRQVVCAGHVRVWKAEDVLLRGADGVLSCLSEEGHYRRLAGRHRLRRSEHGAALLEGGGRHTDCAGQNTGSSIGGGGGLTPTAPVKTRAALRGRGRHTDCAGQKTGSSRGGGGSQRLRRSKHGQLYGGGGVTPTAPVRKRAALGGGGACAGSLAHSMR